jgi:hypothetical protein
MEPEKVISFHFLHTTNQCHQVPVIAIFTKFDGLLTEAYTELTDDGWGEEEALDGMSERAEKLLQTHFRKPLSEAEFPPSDYVRLNGDLSKHFLRKHKFMFSSELIDMREPTSSCNELIQKTANALTDETLRLLFVSVQQNNIDVCIQYALEK